MKSIVINKYEYNGFFDHYFKGEEPWLKIPEQPLIDYVISVLPNYVKNVVIFGCANGRDFIPFCEKFNCFGFDLANPSIINWSCNTENLIYYQCSIEDFISGDYSFDIDFSNSLVYTQGTLMYLSSEDQDKFIHTLIHLGCKNIVIHEYPPDYYGPHTKFSPSTETIKLFERRHFRPNVHGEPTGFLYLNK